MNWKQTNSLAKRFVWRGLALGGNYVWCLDIVTRFKELEVANRTGGGKFQGPHMSKTSQKEYQY